MLTNAVKRRLIREIQDSFSRHPIYKSIVPYVSNRYPETEKPQRAIILKNASSTPMILSSDNYVGTLISHVVLSKVTSHNGNSIEWVRENVPAIKANNNQFPAPAGIYYIEVTEQIEGQYGKFRFMVDPFLSVWGEPLSIIGGQAVVANPPITVGTLTVWRDDRIKLAEGTHYTVDYETGVITFLEDFSGSVVQADYKYQVASRGPYEIGWNTVNTDAIPGVVLAFGRRIEVGDKMAVIVYPERREVAHEYGGQFQMSFDIDVYARDPESQEEICDLVVQYIGMEKKEYLSDEGMTITEINGGGEADEVYDETTDEVYFMASISIGMLTDWSIQVAVPWHISMIDFIDQNAVNTTAMTDEQIARLESSLQLVPTLTRPTIKGRNAEFERIN